jgi:hypothetical protein
MPSHAVGLTDVFAARAGAAAAEHAKLEIIRHHCCPNVFCSMDGNVLIAVGKLQF